jgi:hypothetical protein
MPFPQEEFNPPDDRKTRDASLDVTCLDYVNGHTTAQYTSRQTFGRRSVVSGSTQRACEVCSISRFTIEAQPSLESFFPSQAPFCCVPVGMEIQER